MVDPVTPAVAIPWAEKVEGKLVQKTHYYQMTLGALCGASRALGVDLLGGELAGLPVSTHGPMKIFAALRRRYPSITIEEVEDAFYSSPELRDRYLQAVDEMDKSLAPAIAAFVAHNEAERAKAVPAPLARTPEREASGQPESSS